MATSGATEPRPEEDEEEARRRRAPEPKPEPQVEESPPPEQGGGAVPGEVRTPDPGIEQEARGATEFKEDAVTVTPVPTLVKEEQTVGGRYYDLIADRIERRDAGLRFDVARCNNCGHEETLEPGGQPRKSYKACPVCGDTLRFTGVPLRDPNAEPLPPIDQDELRSEGA